MASSARELLTSLGAGDRVCARPKPDLAPRVIPFIGLTGGIGAGKSTALEALERLGAATLSTDQVVHDLYEDDDVKAAVTERFGPSVAPDGVVDRPALARLAFATPEDRGWLEQMLRGNSEPPAA